LTAAVVGVLVFGRHIVSILHVGEV
jgi:hypothetical protein